MKSAALVERDRRPGYGRFVAQMIPSERPARGPGRRAENALWDALRTLPNDVFVYHGLHYLESSRAEEGETDFIVLDRERGMLVVECKGDGVRRSASGVWTRATHDGERRIESPYAQAQKQVKALVRELTERMSAVIPGRFPFVHGHAVAFPLAELREGALPLEGARETTLFALDLSRIEDWVSAAFDFWRRAATTVPTCPLDTSTFRRFRRLVLHPELDIVESLRARMVADEATLFRLSENQVRTLRGCATGRRVRVAGPAGTGKTLLALETARTYARSPGSRVLLVCFNRPLAQHLSNVVDGWELVAGAIEVTTFHALCRRAFQALGREYEPPPGDDAFAFWNTTAPTTLLEAVADGVIDRFDSVVIDEAQDFAAEWMSVLEDCLRDKRSGHLAIFYDLAQKIFGRATGSSEVPPTFTLTVNFRNTRAIAEVVKQLGRVEMESDERCPAGEPPIVHEAAGPSKTRAQVDEVVDKLLRVERIAPEQITILTPHTRENSSLAAMETVGGAVITDDASDRRGKVLHTTISRYKGLESDVILLVDVDSDDERSDRTACYVAASRARHVLHVWAGGDWMRTR